MPAVRVNFACTVPGCKVPVFTRQMCKPHYARWWKYGDPLAGGYALRDRPVIHRLASFFKIGDGCWDWEGSKDQSGYGHITVRRKSWLAHKLLYETLNGPVPEGMELDHLCRNRACVRLDHLEAVTHAENMRRGREARAAR